MILSRGVRLAGLFLHNGKGRPVGIPRSIRQLSSQSLRSNLTHQTQNILLRSHIKSWPLTFSLRQLTVRLASTTPVLEPTPPSKSISLPEAAAPEEIPTDDLAATLDTFDLSDPLLIPEQAGYLKALGLDYGWGPTAFIEYLLEHVHLYSHTPWWGSIMLTALLVRLAMLKFFINASDQGARLARAGPKLAPIRAKMAAAQAAQDKHSMALVTEELRRINKAEGIRYSKLLGPFLQIPLGYGTFRLMRAMAALPVPGLDTGGFLWITDLTVRDPYFVLPAITSAMLYYTFKKGGETATANSTAMSETMRSVFLYGFPAISFIFTLWWPACMQLTFSTTSVLAFISGRFLANPSARAFLGITPMPTVLPAATTGAYKGVMNVYQAPKPTGEAEQKPKGVIAGAVADIKGAASQFMGKAKKVQESKAPKGRLTPGELRRAKAYEERRRKEIEMEKWVSETRRMRRKGGNA